jgi:hypothetical protein
MYIVLDSCSFNAIATKPKQKGSRKKQPPRFETNLDAGLRSQKVVLVLDDEEGLLNEWSTTSGPEFTKVIVSIWSGWKAVHFVKLSKPLPSNQRRHFREKGWFRDIGDRLVLRIALNSPEKNVVSEDTHFWDPGKPKNRGKQSAPVAKYLREELDVAVYRIGKIVNKCCS